jgi:hypothetical protein
MNPEVSFYNDKQVPGDKETCDLLATTITYELTGAENKIWHAHPVWFLEGNPIVGYSKQKAGVRLMFWSGADFGVEALNIRGKKFKDASIIYNSAAAIDTKKLRQWLQLSIEIQWDYKSIAKRKGVLDKLK